MLRTFKTEGVVVKRINFAETDKLVSLFTKKRGKIVVLAKGIRKIHSKKAPHLELFSHVNICITGGGALNYINEVQTIESFFTLRSHIERVAYAFRIVEEVERLCAEKQEHRVVFDLLLHALRKLNSKNVADIGGLVDEFTLKLLWELGYLPRGKLLPSVSLERYIEQVMERGLKSKSLLSKLFKV